MSFVEGCERVCDVESVCYERGHSLDMKCVFFVDTMLEYIFHIATGYQQMLHARLLARSSITTNISTTKRHYPQSSSRDDPSTREENVGIPTFQASSNEGI